MAFDFTDYVYSALITIFSMIMGMAYPLVNSSIGDIDNKYGSTHIVKSFIRENRYRRFQVSLALSIVAAIISPFILLCINGFSVCIIIWLALHTFVVLSLIVSAIQLYQMMMEYKMPNAIAERFSKRISIDDNILLEAEIARYAARHNFSELYLDCTQSVCGELARQMNYNKVKMNRSAMFNTPGRETRLTEYAKKAIAIYTSIICDDDVRWSLYKTDISIVSTLFSTSKALLEGDRLMIWNIVSEVARYGNEDWIKAYWTQATQYLSFFDQHRGYWDLSADERKKCDSEKHEFKKMHIALIGMLIEYGRQSYVENLLYHSRTLPYTYPLCDNTFLSLYKDWKDFYCNEETYHLINQLNKYPIKGLNGNINDEWKLIRIIEKSLALQLLRLKGMDYNVEYAEPLDLLEPEATIEEKQYQLRMLSRMSEAVSRIFAEGLETSLSGRNYFTQLDALAFIQKNVNSLNGAIAQYADNPTIDVNKRQRLVLTLKSKWEEASLRYGEPVGFVAYTASESPCELGVDIPDSYILEGYEIVSYDDFVDSIISGSKSIVYRSFAYVFEWNHPKHIFNVQYTDVGKALERLELTTDHIVLCNDFYIDRFFAIYKNERYREDGDLRFFNGARMIEISAPATTPFIIIIRKDLLPYVEIGDYADARLPIISCNPFLYSNLPIVNENTYKHTRIRFKTYTYIPDDFNFIKLTMPYKTGDSDLNKVRALSYLE